MPDATAQHYVVSLAVDRSLKYAYVSDENVHSFARSRASPDNVSRCLMRVIDAHHLTRHHRSCRTTGVRVFFSQNNGSCRYVCDWVFLEILITHLHPF